MTSLGGFVFGLFVGAAFGVLVGGLNRSASDADDRMEAYSQGREAERLAQMAEHHARPKAVRG